MHSSTEELPPVPDKLLVMTDVKRNPNAIESGDPHSADRLLPLVYDRLRKLAAQKLALEKPGQTLDATALVHEAYVRLVVSPQREQGKSASLAGAAGSPEFANRAHFFAAAAEAMRRILVEAARRKHRVKHGGELRRVDVQHIDISEKDDEIRLLGINEVLDRLEAEAPEAANVAKLRYFVGLTAEETADAMGISLRSVHRHWAFAKAWLFDALQ